MGNISPGAGDYVDNILSKYGTMVYRLAFARTKNRADSDDVMQEVFMRLIKHNVSFSDDEHCKAWLIRATVNCSKSLLTSAWFRRTVPLEDEFSVEIDTKDEILTTVLKLPVKYRTVIHLHYYEDYSIAKIAEVLSMKEATVKTHLHRARNLLKETLKGEYGYV